jgi:hypothetical protein
MIVHFKGGSQAVLTGASGAALIFGRLPSQPSGQNAQLDELVADATRRPPRLGREEMHLIPGGIVCCAIIASSTVVLSYFLNVMDALATVYG